MIWTVVVPIVVVPLIVVMKLLPGSSVAAADAGTAVLPKSDEIEVGRDCPLAGIGMILVGEALEAALVCNGWGAWLFVVELVAVPVANARDVAVAMLVAIDESGSILVEL